MEAPHNTRTYRAPWHDYSKPGCYMLTLNTYPRRAILGRPANDRIWLSEQGRVVARVWWALTKRYPEIICIFFCIMPDHLHWLLRIRKQLPHPLSFYMFRFMEETAKELGDVWERSFNDGIIFNSASLKYRLQYLKDNPHRLCERLAHPEMFVRLNDLKHSRLPGGTPLPWTGYGNRFLLDCPDLIPVQVSRRVTPEQMEEWHERVRVNLRAGAVFVSPFISPGEKKVAEWVLEEKGRLVVLKDGGFPQLYKPSARYFDACAAGRCLVLSCYPWTGRRREPGEFRPICLAMNAWVRQICQLPKD